MEGRMMSQNELYEVVTPEIKKLEEQAHVLNNIVEMLRNMTRANRDVNFSVLESINKILTINKEFDVRKSVGSIKAAFGLRAKTKLKELGAFR